MTTNFCYFETWKNDSVNILILIIEIVVLVRSWTNNVVVKLDDGFIIVAKYWY